MASHWARPPNRWLFLLAVDHFGRQAAEISWLRRMEKGIFDAVLSPDIATKVSLNWNFEEGGCG